MYTLHLVCGFTFRNCGETGDRRCVRVVSVYSSIVCVSKLCFVFLWSYRSWKHDVYVRVFFILKLCMWSRQRVLWARKVVRTLSIRVTFLVRNFLVISRCRRRHKCVRMILKCVLSNSVVTKVCYKQYFWASGFCQSSDILNRTQCSRTVSPASSGETGRLFM
jgi:hypothetical protein